MKNLLSSLLISLMLANQDRPRPEPPVPAEIMLPDIGMYVTWRTRFALDGVEIDREQLDNTLIKLVEVQLQGRKVRWAIFETIGE